MARAFTPKVITANALIEGDVIYLAEDGAWTRELTHAALLTDEADADLRLLEAQQKPGEAVGPYLADAEAGPFGPEPTHFREEFRAVGPSNYFHGKQAEGVSGH